MFSSCREMPVAATCQLERTVALVDAVVLRVGRDDLGGAVTVAEGGGLLPVVPEAAHVGEFGWILDGAGDQSKRAAALDRGQLRPVADEQHLRARSSGVCVEPVEHQGSGEGGFVHDHHLPGTEVPLPGGVLVRPLRRVLRLNVERFAEYLGRRGRRREPDHRPGAHLCLPRGTQDAKRSGLAGAGRPHEHVERTRLEVAIRPTATA